MLVAQGKCEHTNRQDSRNTYTEYSMNYWMTFIRYDLPICAGMYRETSDIMFDISGIVPGGAIMAFY